jgi:hypothetical protein
MTTWNCTEKEFAVFCRNIRICDLWINYKNLRTEKLADFQFADFEKDLLAHLCPLYSPPSNSRQLTTHTPILMMLVTLRRQVFRLVSTFFYEKDQILTHLCSEAEFLDEIQTKVWKVFCLIIYSHLYSFALRFLFLQTPATSYSF